MRREFDLRKCFQEKETGSFGDEKRGRGTEAGSPYRLEPSEELDCTPLAAVIVKVHGMRKPYTAPQTQLRYIIFHRRILMSEAADKKKSIDIKGKRGVSHRSLSLSELLCLILSPKSREGWGR